MESDPNKEIFSSRVFNAPVESVYRAFADPSYLKKWWGPNGFTNTIHEFDLRPGGKWVLTMHGPEAGHYENASVFKVVDPLRFIKWERISKPLFEMELAFGKLDEKTTKFSFRMIFDTAEECAKIRSFAVPKNEEDFDRLEAVLKEINAEN